MRALIALSEPCAVTLNKDLNARLSAALVKAYGRVPVAWALSTHDYELVKHMPTLLALPFAPGGDVSVLVVKDRQSDAQSEIPV